MGGGHTGSFANIYHLLCWQGATIIVYQVKLNVRLLLLLSGHFALVKLYLRAVVNFVFVVFIIVLFVVLVAVLVVLVLLV